MRMQEITLRARRNQRCAARIRLVEEELDTGQSRQNVRKPGLLELLNLCSSVGSKVDFMVE